MGREPRDYDERGDGRGYGPSGGDRRGSGGSSGRGSRGGPPRDDRAYGSPPRNGSSSGSRNGRGPSPSDPRAQRGPASNGLIRKPFGPGGENGHDQAPRGSGPRRDRYEASDGGYGDTPPSRSRRGSSRDRYEESDGRGQNDRPRRGVAQRARDLSRQLSRQLSSMAHGAERGVRRAAQAARNDFQPSPAALSAEALAELPPSRFRRSRIRLRARKWRIQRQPPNPITYFITFGVVAVLISLVFGGVGAGGLYAISYYNQSLPQIQAVASKLQAENGSIIYDRNGTPLYQFSDNGAHNFYVGLKYISKYLQQATIDTEDHTFYSNVGIDFQGTARAILTDTSSGSAAQGASTITQQLVKLIVLDDTNKAITRKLNEAILAIGVTENYTKQQILEMYLNSIPYGNNNTGIEAAAENFFGLKQKKLPDGTMQSANSQLDIAQAALLAGLPNNPTRFNPTWYSAGCKGKTPCDPSKWDNPCFDSPQEIIQNGCVHPKPAPDQYGQKYDKSQYTDWTQEGHEWLVYIRTGIILNNMAQYGDITQAQEASAKAEVLKMLENESILNYAAQESETNKVGNKLAPDFVDYVTTELQAQFHINVDDLPKMGLHIYTTLDYPLEYQAEHGLDYYLMEKHTQKWYCHGPQADPFDTPCVDPPLSQMDNANDGAVVAIDPHTGDIMAMVGSSQYANQSKKVGGYLNMAVLPRSMGSATKGIVYATAFQMGWTPGTMLQDVPICFPTPAGNDPTTGKPAVTNPYAPACKGWYAPTNYDTGSFSGIAPLRVQLSNSLNIAATEAMAFIGDGSSLEGAAPFITMARRLGITTIDPSRIGPSTTLGTTEIPLYQLTDAYATFANGGAHAPVRSILRIDDHNGVTLWDAGKAKAEQVISPEAAYELTSVLVSNEARIPDFNIYNPLRFDKQLNGNPDFPTVQIAAKTGTSEGTDPRHGGPNDIITEGYSPYLAVGVWVGNVDSPDSLNQGVIGITGAGYVFHDVMQYAIQHYKWPGYGGANTGSTVFPVPADMAIGTFNCITGLAPYKGTTPGTCKLKGIQTSKGSYPTYTDLYAGFVGTDGKTGHWDHPDQDWYIKGQAPLMS